MVEALPGARIQLVLEAGQIRSQRRRESHAVGEITLDDRDLRRLAQRALLVEQQVVQSSRWNRIEGLGDRGGELEWRAGQQAAGPGADRSVEIERGTLGLRREDRHRSLGGD